MKNDGVNKSVNNVTLHKFSSFPEGLDGLACDIKNRDKSLDAYYVVLTPDRYTLAVENALFVGGGALNCEVLTISRLTNRIVGGENLSSEAEIMLVSRAIDECKKQGLLRYYVAASQYVDFARDAHAALNQIGSSDADIDELINCCHTAATSDKLKDLASIKKVYDRLKKGYDACDRLVELIKKVPKSELIRSSHVYAIGYKNLTKLNKKALNVIANFALSFDVYDAENATKRKELTLYSCQDAPTEYKAVATEIRQYVYEDDSHRYGDIDIICNEPATLNRILNEFDVPFYSEAKTLLFDTPPLSALYALYNVALHDDVKTAVDYAKNIYSGCDRESAESFEIALKKSGIRYGALSISLSDEKAAEAQKQIKKAADVFRKCTPPKKSGGNEKTDKGEKAKFTFSDACLSVMEQVGYQKIFDEKSSGTNQIEPILSLLNLLDGYGSTNFKEDADAFFAASKALSVKSLPRKKDRVTVCAPQSLRLTRCKKLFILDFNEGMLPITTAENGLLSDGELQGFAGAVEPTAREVNRRDREELRAVAVNASDVFIAYAESNGKAAAFIDELADNIIYRSYLDDCLKLKATDDKNEIAKYACTVSSAREVAALDKTSYSSSVLKSVGDAKNKFQKFTPYITTDKIANTYFTELDNWFNCPYQRFLKCVIGLSDGAGTAAKTDVGQVAHATIERVVNDAISSDAPLNCDADYIAHIVNDILDERGLLTGDEIKRGELIAQIVPFVELNKTVLDAGDYKPIYTEYGFSNIPLTADVTFSGAIDRIDACGTDERIIDYKTGSIKTFDPADCDKGKGLQLPLYVWALRNLNDTGAINIGGDATGEKRVTGAFYMSPRPNFYSSKSKLNSDTCLLSGCMAESELIRDSYDLRPEEERTENVIPDKSKKKSDDEKTAEFNEIVEGCADMARLAVSEINSGYIEKKPLDNGTCGFCPFGALCADKKIRENGNE